MSITSTMLSLKGAEEQEWKDLYNYIIKLEQENNKHKNWVDVLNKDNHRLHSIIKEVREEIEYFDLQARHLDDSIYLDERLTNKLLEILDKGEQQ